jgi:hypothetical protein
VPKKAEQFVLISNSKFKPNHCLAVVDFKLDSTMCELSIHKPSMDNETYTVKSPKLVCTPGIPQVLNYIRRNVVPGLAYSGIQPDSIPWAVLSFGSSTNGPGTPNEVQEPVPRAVVIRAIRQFVFGSFDVPNAFTSAFRYSITALDLFGILQNKEIRRKEDKVHDAQRAMAAHLKVMNFGL